MMRAATIAVAAAFRTPITTATFLSFPFSRLLKSPNPNPLFLLPFSTRRLSTSSPPDSLSTPDFDPSFPPSPSPVMEAQFEGFRLQLEESGGLRERIRGVVAEIEAASRLVNATLLLVHQSLPLADVLAKSNVQIEVIKGLFRKLAEIMMECPGQYYRYHGDWRSETQTVVSMLAFLHWLETASLLVHGDAEKKLGLDSPEFCLDIEDYLIGLCFMSNEFPRYVVNRVTAGDYDCPRKVLSFLTDLHASFRMLNLRNDFLRKKFDGMKYDLRRVEEVYYDVKIRGLAPEESTKEATQS